MDLIERKTKETNEAKQSIEMSLNPLPPTHNFSSLFIQWLETGVFDTEHSLTFDEFTRSIVLETTKEFMNGRLKSDDNMGESLIFRLLKMKEGQQLLTNFPDFEKKLITWITPACLNQSVASHVHRGESLALWLIATRDGQQLMHAHHDLRNIFLHFLTEETFNRRVEGSLNTGESVAYRLIAGVEGQRLLIESSDLVAKFITWLTPLTLNHLIENSITRGDSVAYRLIATALGRRLLIAYPVLAENFVTWLTEETFNNPLESGSCKGESVFHEVFTTVEGNYLLIKYPSFMKNALQWITQYNLNREIYHQCVAYGLLSDVNWEALNQCPSLLKKINQSILERWISGSKGRISFSLRNIKNAIKCGYYTFDDLNEGFIQMLINNHHELFQDNPEDKTGFGWLPREILNTVTTQGSPLNRIVTTSSGFWRGGPFGYFSQCGELMARAKTEISDRCQKDKSSMAFSSSI